jgi:hypothetical protein
LVGVWRQGQAPRSHPSFTRARVPAPAFLAPALLRHILRLHSDLGRLASLDVLRAGSGGITNHTRPSSEYYRHRLLAEV